MKIKKRIPKKKEAIDESENLQVILQNIQSKSTGVFDKYRVIINSSYCCYKYSNYRGQGHKLPLVSLEQGGVSIRIQGYTIISWKAIL